MLVFRPSSHLLVALFCKFIRRQIAQGTVRPEPVIVLPPALYLLSGIFDGQEPVHVQALVPEAAVKGLDEGIVHGLSRPREAQLYHVVVCPPEFELEFLLDNTLFTNILFDILF